MKSGLTVSNSEAVRFLEALLEGVPDEQFLEIRTIRKGGGAKKKFSRLSKLRKQGLERALPSHLDGKENIYYGVAPRCEPREAASGVDRGDVVNLATSLWLDEITLPPADLPPFSRMVETSVGKVQAGYLLKEPTSDLDRVEHLNQRLGVVVGGDNVWNRGRILRLPGFINLNHPGGQRAKLVELHPHRRYTLDELDRLLPCLPQEGPGPFRMRHTYLGSFDPHWPCALPQELQDRLTYFFKGLGLRYCPDGRYHGACPLPHRNSSACDCPSAFYTSPVSGSWTCFCSDHIGPTSGTVRAFAPLGFVADLTLAEVQSQIGRYHLGPGEARHHQGSPRQGNKTHRRGNVANTVLTKGPIYRKGDNPRGKRPSLWKEAQSLFPIPTHIKPRVRGYLLWSDRDNKGVAVDLFSNTWRNLANAQFKRQKLHFNILPRTQGPQIYQRRVPIDDWDNKVHRRISRAIQRASTELQGWLWIDNSLERGYILYLTDAPGVAGFEPVEEVKPALIGLEVHPAAQ